MKLVNNETINTYSYEAVAVADDLLYNAFYNAWCYEMDTRQKWLEVATRALHNESGKARYMDTLYTYEEANDMYDLCNKRCKQYKEAMYNRKEEIKELWGDK